MDTSLSDPLVGRLLEGRYIVESLIAHGGMATVYLATDTRLERRVAVKVMHAHLSEDAETVARFEREARAAARLSNPDVVAVYDQGSDAGRAFLVMEFVPGANLRQIIRDRGRLSPGEAVAVMDHVLAALATAHAAGLVHRDVKPENILVTADGRVKVADFGLARAVSGSTVTTTGSVLMGTAAYLAPEQFLHGTADARSDVYSAGVLFFELLTGNLPFEADGAYALLNRHAKEDIPAPSTREPGIEPQLDALVTWATSRDPQERPADAGEFHAELIDVRDRLGLHSRVPAPPVNQTQRFETPRAVDLTQAVAPGAATTMRAPRVDGGRGGRDNGRPGGTTPSPRRRRRRRGFVLAGVMTLVVAAAAVTGWYFAAGRYTHAPNVLGATRASANSQLTSAGLHPHWLSAVTDLHTPVGRVANESPTGRVARGATIDLALSLGPAKHQLPSVAGLTVSQATAKLRDLNIGVGSTTQVFRTHIKKGHVVSTVPAVGATVSEGGKVGLVVSKGPDYVFVPQMVNLPEQAATTQLDGMGFVVHTQQAFSKTVTTGYVVSTDPAQGVRAIRGDPITLTISKGPPVFNIPDVRGQQIDDAMNEIQAAGFVPHPVQVFPGGPNRVLREKPRTQMVPHGTVITLDYF
jgi:eukaryotic-like serine/threonine-protein kinase